MKLFTKNLVGWAGLITATIVSKDGSTKVVKFHNLITDAGLNMMRDGLTGSATNLAIRYFAVGTGSTAPAATDTALVTEVFRKPFLSVAASATTGEVNSQVILESDEANVAIAELGWFAGASASATSGSGILVARTLFSHSKTNAESIYLDRTDILAGS